MTPGHGEVLGEGDGTMNTLFLWHEFKYYCRIQEEDGKKSVWFQRGSQWVFMRDVSDAEYNLFYRGQAEYWQQQAKVSERSGR